MPLETIFLLIIIMQRVNFKSEDLVVDYISFNFQKLEDSKQTKIADYLEKIGFNSYQQFGKLAKPIKEPILVDSENQFETLFVKEGPYWDGTMLQFSGSNANRFYSLIKQQLICWTLFSPVTLGRLDICYSRENKMHDKTSVTEFFENCHRKLKQTNKNVSFEKNTKGLILKIGNRKSNHYSRIYQGKNSFKFEHC